MTALTALGIGLGFQAFCLVLWVVVKIGDHQYEKTVTYIDVPMPEEDPEYWRQMFLEENANYKAYVRESERLNTDRVMSRPNNPYPPSR